MLSRLGRFEALLGVAAGALAATGAGAAELAPMTADCGPSSASQIQQTRCVRDDGDTRLSIRSSMSNAMGTIETFTTVSSQAGNAFTPERLVASDTRRLGNAHQVMIAGMTARLLDNRITFTTEMGLSQYVDRADVRADRRDGSAQMVRLDLKLLDNPDLQWSVAGEMSAVSDDFFIGPAMADGARLALPGNRLALSSTLNWRRTRFSTAIDDYRSRFGTFGSGRFGISRNGVSLSLRTTHGEVDAGEGLGLLSARTDNQSATIELDLATMFPALALDERLPAALLPKYAMIGYRQGSSENLFAGTAEDFERHGIELNGTWETPIGETSIGYWTDRRMGATAELGRREEQVVNLSHMVRAGDWRFGVDAMISRNMSTRGSGLDERNVSFGGSIAYEVANGPRLMVQLSNDRGRMAAEDDSFLTARRGQQVSASLDLTDYLRQRFERNDLRFKIDYRKQLDRSTTAVSAYQQLVDRWTDGFTGEGLLVSFGMKL